ncbi:hypothetical protein PFICI_12712 [Pestalotiopsis fici W106-1]|uniref:Intradiol ring-cleavage dioxygenases domain-containing protein n=1 Tax=Pestalotiopsis fici (strain W106-1 / CGMCC3.15140) TaxID=1229662 RepID=W3WPI9_PESFW|nr:uncharacterized protein PFICI_12712 [Pestalotiopsis fici W106-1]ETS75768.1 hypothetical protein PFICI_12712 [Pestalotiopsis fici W106-1]
MFTFKALAAALAVISIFGTTSAHPGERHSPSSVKREAERYREAHARAARAFSQIDQFPRALELQERAVARRFATWNALRAERGIASNPSIEKRTKEDLDKYLAISHDVSDTGYTLDTPTEVIFGSNATAALVQEAILGPYFASGELLRTDVTEGIAGVPLHLDIQFIDINTMDAVEDLYVDIWQCNALGVYSGVALAGQAGLNTTWLRGFQVSNEEGVVEFDTIVPGHYAGRTHHIHILTTINSTMLPNNTYVPGITNHAGQFFFEQSLVDEVETLDPYNTNTQVLVKTADDDIAQSVATSVDDPLLQYVRLSDNLQDGLLAYITVGIDLKANHSDSYQPAAHWEAGGGVSLPGWVPSLPGGVTPTLPPGVPLPITTSAGTITSAT